MIFVLKGEHRINLDKVKRYKPSEKCVSKGINYIVEFIYDDGESEEFNFFDDKRWRDQMIETLDRMLVKKEINEKTNSNS